MRKVKEVLRLRFELGFGQRQIARSCGIGSTVYEYLDRAVAAGVRWPLPEGLSEEELEGKLFGNQPVPASAVQQRPQPDWKAIHEQLQQHRHLTLQLNAKPHPEMGYRSCLASFAWRSSTRRSAWKLRHNGHCWPRLAAIRV
jgi:hypothetical protein